MNTSNMTCAQVQDYVKTHGQTLLTTGIESGNYSFNYADCGGTVPGFACTTDEAYCYVGWWCDYNYPVAVNPNVHDQGDQLLPGASVAKIPALGFPAIQDPLSGRGESSEKAGIATLKLLPSSPTIRYSPNIMPLGVVKGQPEA